MDLYLYWLISNSKYVLPKIQGGLKQRTLTGSSQIVLNVASKACFL